jgi:hypothetical protein
MKNEFVPYDIALTLKELGFNEECLALYVGKSKKLTNKNTPFSLHKDAVRLSTPLYQQAFRWFREKHNIDTFPSKTYNYYFAIYINGELYEPALEN